MTGTGRRIPPIRLQKLFDTVTLIVENVRDPGVIISQAHLTAILTTLDIPDRQKSNLVKMEDDLTNSHSISSPSFVPPRSSIPSPEHARPPHHPFKVFYSHTSPYSRSSVRL